MKPKIENKPFYCNAWVSKVSTEIMCNTIPCCGFCMGPNFEKSIKEENSFKKYNTLGSHPLCPDCLVEVEKKWEQETDWYGKLAYYKCKNCKETFVSQREGELEIAAP